METMFVLNVYIYMYIDSCHVCSRNNYLLSCSSVLIPWHLTMKLYTCI